MRFPILSILARLVPCLVLWGCSGSRVEPDMRVRSVLVEPEVYEYSFGAGMGPSSSFNFELQGLLPRHRVTENLEFSRIPMPMLSYRVLNRSALELALGGGFPWIPFVGLVFASSGDTTISWVSPLPMAFQASLEGKWRAPGTGYSTLRMLGQQGWAEQSGNAFLGDWRFGKAFSRRFAAEAGLFLLASSMGAGEGSTESYTALTLNLRLNQLTDLHFNPYLEYAFPLDPTPYERTFLKAGLRLGWFW